MDGLTIILIIVFVYLSPWCLCVKNITHFICTIIRYMLGYALAL